MLGLRLCVRTFSCCGKWGPLFIAVRGPLTVPASLVAEHRLQTQRILKVVNLPVSVCARPVQERACPPWGTRERLSERLPVVCYLVHGCVNFCGELSFCSFCWLDTVVGKWWRVPCIQDMIVVTNNHFVLSVHVCVLIFSFYKDPSHTGLEPAHLTSIPI